MNTKGNKIAQHSITRTEDAGRSLYVHIVKMNNSIYRKYNTTLYISLHIKVVTASHAVPSQPVFSQCNPRVKRVRLHLYCSYHCAWMDYIRQHGHINTQNNLCREVKLIKCITDVNKQCFHTTKTHSPFSTIDHKKRRKQRRIINLMIV